MTMLWTDHQLIGIRTGRSLVVVEFFEYDAELVVGVVMVREPLDDLAETMVQVDAAHREMAHRQIVPRTLVLTVGCDGIAEVVEPLHKALLLQQVG